MGRVWGPDAVAKNQSTSLYGNIVALAESPLVEGSSTSAPTTASSRSPRTAATPGARSSASPACPSSTYVSRPDFASQHDADVVYAAFNNHKMGDFKPYLLRSDDRGRTWRPIAGDLPARHRLDALAEDHVDADLLFAGTEFGLFFTRRRRPRSGSSSRAACRRSRCATSPSRSARTTWWLGTFGRGFYVLDDYTPLRHVDARLARPGGALPVKKTWLHVPGSRIGDRDKGFLGETYYTADNPPFGATFTYYVKEEWTSKKKARQKAEKEAAEASKELPFPSFESLRDESREEDAKLLFTVADAAGHPVRRLEAPGQKAIAADHLEPALRPGRPGDRSAGERSPWLPPLAGPFAAPGTYNVRLERLAGGVVEPLAGPVAFEVEALGNATLPAKDRAAVLAFQQKVARLQRAVLGAVALAGELDVRLELVRVALDATPALDAATDARARALELELESISIALSGDRFLRRAQENTPPAIDERVMNVVYASWYTTAEPTRTQLDAYRYAGELFAKELGRLRRLAETDLPAIEAELERAGAPWTPGRIPLWQPEP
jgi:hypothetical protein